MRSEEDIGLIILHGLGVEGRAALAWLLNRSACPIIAIDRPEATDALPPEQLGNARLSVATEDAFALPGSPDTDEILYLRSPGVPPANPVFTAIREAGITHTTPTGYWLARHAPAGTITITGTKGKSTTASLTAALLRWGDIEAEEMGNIGRTPFEAAPAKGTICVFELSSYMMHDLPPADIFHVVTSLYTEHTDWHGSHAAYAADKLRPFSFSPPAPGLVSEAVGKYLPDRPGGVRLLEDVAPIEDGAIRLDASHSISPASLNDAFAAPSMVLALRAAIATCLARELLSATEIAAALTHHLPGWRGLPCRQEKVESDDGRDWIDDALATVPEATLSALTRWADSPVRLILGGKNRGQDFARLLDACARHGNVSLHVFDETGAIIADAAPQGLSVRRTDSLEDAISSAREESAPGDIILFSPAAPSSAAHGNYKVRSEIFKRLARESRR